jgi:MFS superfamily sulfate permease-like transporter
LVNLARRASNPAVDILAGSDDPTVSLLDEVDDVRETAPGVIIMRFAAPIFFANGSVLADRARNAVESAPHPVTTFVLDLEAVTDIDVTGAGALIALREWLRSRSVTLGFSRVRPPQQERFTRFGLLESARLYRTNRDVVSAFRMEFTTPDADVPER